MWKCRSSYGDKCCSLHDSIISKAAFENKVLYMRFEDGIVLLPATWANPFKDKCYRSDSALIAITVEDKRVSIPQDAIRVLIRGSKYLFGKALGRYEKQISIDELIEDIEGNPEKYEIMDVYSSEDGGKLLLCGVIHANAGLSADDEFEMIIHQKMGAQMRFFWNELELEKPL